MLWSYVARSDRKVTFKNNISTVLKKIYFFTLPRQLNALIANPQKSLCKWLCKVYSYFLDNVTKSLIITATYKRVTVNPLQ